MSAGSGAVCNGAESQSILHQHINHPVLMREPVKFIARHTTQRHLQIGAIVLLIASIYFSYEGTISVITGILGCSLASLGLFAQRMQDAVSHIRESFVKFGLQGERVAQGADLWAEVALELKEQILPWVQSGSGWNAAVSVAQLSMNAACVVLMYKIAQRMIRIEQSTYGIGSGCRKRYGAH